ncbi:MAG: SemiSWEET family transporter [Candidatus Paceibacterota bacterium]
MNDILANLIGYTAAAVGTFLMLPQVIKSYKSKKTADLSMAMVIIYVINCFLWMIYGFFLSAIPMIVANGIGFIISVVQLVLKLKYNS